MNLDQIPQPTPGLIWRLVDDGAVLVSPEKGKVRVLNPVGTRLWQRICEANLSGTELVRYLEETYAISAEKATTDLDAFLTDLAERGLLVWSSPV